jgi:tyrosyl-tRNA synthetase
LEALSREVPFASVDSFTNIVDGLVALGLVASKGAARRLVEQGGASINGRRVSLTDPVGEPLAGKYFLLRKGSRDYGLLELRN